MASYQGPTRPGIDTSYFRDTGQSRTYGQVITGNTGSSPTLEKSGRSGGSSSRRRREAARRAAEKAAQEAAAKKAAAERQAAEAAAKEQARIADLQKKLIAAGARKSQQIVRDTKTGEVKRVITTIQGMGQKVKIYDDRQTGNIYTKTFKGGRLSGGLTTRGGTTSSGSGQKQVQVFQSSNPNKLKVIMPNGRAQEISPTGRVVIGKGIAGERLEFMDGVLVRRGDYKPQKMMGGEVTAAPTASGLAGIQLSLTRARGTLRNKNTGISGAKLTGYAVVSGLVDTVAGVIDMPKTIAYLAKNPSELRNIPSQIAKAGAGFGYLLQTSTNEALGYAGGSYLGLKGTNAALKGLSRTRGAIVARLNKNFVDGAKVGKTFNIKLGGGRTVKIQVVNKIPKATLERQIGLAGKRVNAISSQADELVGFIKRNKVVKKPLGKTKTGRTIESALSQRGKRLLKKLDNGNIKKGELYDLDLEVRALGGKGIMERFGFADPTGKIRPSRLPSVLKEKSKILDYFADDITFKKPKPQVLLFDDLPVSSYPKRLQPLAKKILQKKPLTQAESGAWLEWYMKKTGTAKPLGFNSLESEIVFSPGEIIRRVKKVGVLRINGKNVPIVRAKLYKPTPQVRTLINKYKAGKLTAAETRRLNDLLKKQTGFNYGLSSSPSVRARYVSIKRIGISSSGKLFKTSRRASVGVSRRTPTSRTSKTSRTSTSRKGSSRVVKKGSSRKKGGSSRKKGGSSPKRGGSSGKPRGGSSPRKGGSSRGGSSGTSRGRTSKPPVRPVPVRVPKNYKAKTLSKPVQTYYVVEKVRGKFKKLYPKPLPAKYARDLAVYRIDHRLSKTAFFVPLGKRKSVVQPPKNIQGYYSKHSNKVRPYKIRYGQKKLMVNGYIEKRKYFQDTKGERSQAARLRAKSKKKVTKRKTPVRKRKGTTTRKRVVKVVKKRVVKRPVRKTPVKRKVVRKNIKKRRTATRKRK